MLGKALIPKKEEVMDYHEVHVKPNSINGLPPFMLDRNQVLIVNPPKKNQRILLLCNPKERKRKPTRIGKHGA